MFSALPFVRSYRRRKFLARPFPAAWEPIVAEHYGFVARLDASEAEGFRNHLKVFVWEKHWLGTQGLVIDEAMKVVIAGAAARIARRLPLGVYDRLTEVVVYPTHYLHPQSEAIIYGQAHHFGTVVLSWDAVRHGIATTNDGHDTAIHEFAHVLDIADGAFDGTPLLGKNQDYDTWARVMGYHFARLQQHPQRSILRSYGALNEAEFFAVATETFFEKPRLLKQRAPELYAELSKFFGIDPQ
ncbi:MAG: zinc-dependent peptidase [Bradymonadaceae bacterium]|nr:zinc-dependent peptidase [Lujinxingiaceae bacterium]